MARSIARNHDEKRASLLKTAAAFFARHGYDRASMSELAKASGVSKALFYHYYDSKDALLFGILDGHLRGLAASLEALDLPDAPEARLHLIAFSLLDAYRDADAEHKLQLDAMASLPDEAQRVLKSHQRRLVGIMSDAIEAAAPELFARRPELLRPVTMSAFGMLNWFYMWHRRGAGVTREEYAALASDLILGGLARVERQQPGITRTHQPGQAYP
ncbi:TetR/AcrR family transcriptional regulator [Oricola cellulosilytica]|uniref:TetR/AcrR family transcriptional regulator n=1 Tax=Oricola cellulosilytica TaxID=1429082 RepID=A0A4R0PEB2_9HYPH|nr:TetR/AcrR family transcriptional regulator [Oricola cellulosilytica]TCD14958.1 TetR/AcrR family transcriptional regulator [Oricola cellulosilytica]